MSGEAQPTTSQSPTATTRSSRRAWIPAAVLVAGAAALIAYLWHAWVPFEGNERLSRGEVERIGQFQFPRNASNVATNQIGFVETTLRVRFTAPPKEVAVFLRGCGFVPPLPSTSIPELIARPGPPPPWWQPGSPAVFEAGEVITPRAARRPSLHKAVLIDKTPARAFTVWLVTFRALPGEKIDDPPPTSAPSIPVTE